jgi:pimeloyl-ACP methyl ester carboxylesterase
MLALLGQMEAIISTFSVRGWGEDAALRFIEVVFDLPEGAASTEAGATIWRENGRTVLPYILMDPPAEIDCARLRDITSPMLIVQGADSHVRFAMMAERVATCAGNAVVTTMAEVNHDGPYRAPDRLGDKIEGFLKAVEE